VEYSLVYCIHTSDVLFNYYINIIIILVEMGKRMKRVRTGDTRHSNIKKRMLMLAKFYHSK
jgi:hypothetical protein